MMEEDLNDMDFFITTMPATRPADYHLGYLEGAVFIDFDDHPNELIRLKGISFDGYGYCGLGTQAIPMGKVDSRAFKAMIEAKLLDQSVLTTIVKKTLLSNRKLIWEGALKEYGLS